MAIIGRRGRPAASGVVPFAGNGLGLPVTTQLPTRQWQRPARRHFRQIPIDWRPDGPTTYGSSSGPDSPTTAPCEDCT